MAAALSTGTGIAYRYGPSYAQCHDPGESFPTAWEPDDKINPPNGNYPGGVYQVGGPWSADVGDFSSSQGQGIYVPATPGGGGVATLSVLEMGNQTFADRPQLSWTFYGAGNPDPNETNADWLTLNGGPVDQPVAQSRTYARGESSANTLVAFQSGLIGSFGPNTARASVSLRLPAGKVPTAIAVTGNNEFALVTVWDTTASKGQIAVIALGDQHPNLAAGDTGDFFGFDWSELYPGLMNYGFYTFMKLLGFVDLPGMQAPTEISASLDYRSNEWLSLPGGGNAEPSQLTLSNETNRQTFVTGANSAKYPKAGFAVVISRSEKKAAFVDLQPLFAAFAATYFGDQATFAAAMANTGQAASQWPPTFDQAPASAPVLTTAVSLPQTPTAVRTSIPRNGGPAALAYVATMDGTITSFAVGGLADTTASDPAAVHVVDSSLHVGFNPTSLVPSKDHTSVDAATTLIAVSRADRRIDWIGLGADNLGTVTRTLRDARIVDPIAAEDVNNHGTESYVLTVADYAGNAIRNYRYGPVIFATNGGAKFGMGPTGTDAFEYEGAFLPGGAPFGFSTTNVP